MLRHHKPAEQAPASPTKAGWRVNEWASDTGVSRAYVYNLLAAGEIQSVKVGSARIITTRPADFLARLARNAIA